MLTQAARVFKRHTTVVTDIGHVAGVDVSVVGQSFLVRERLVTKVTGKGSHVEVSQLVLVQTATLVKAATALLTEKAVAGVDLLVFVQILLRLKTLVTLVALVVVVVAVDYHLMPLEPRFVEEAHAA